jgi:hypothetical protein
MSNDLCKFLFKSIVGPTMAVVARFIGGRYIDLLIQKRSKIGYRLHVEDFTYLREHRRCRRPHLVLLERPTKPSCQIVGAFYISMAT